MIASESAHRTESGFEPTVVAFDTVAGILLRVVKRAGHEILDRSTQRGRPVGHDLDRLTMGAENSAEEPSCCSEIAAGGDEYVDDLTVLVDRAVYVTPGARDLHVGLVDEPAITDRMATRFLRHPDRRARSANTPARPGR